MTQQLAPSMLTDSDSKSPALLEPDSEELWQHCPGFGLVSQKWQEGKSPRRSHSLVSC